MRVSGALKIINIVFLRFIVSGGFNTVLTYAIYLALLNFLPYKKSYTISYVIGIVLAYLLNRFFVFRSHQGIRTAVIMPFIYLVQYVLALSILWIWVEVFHLDDHLAPLSAIILTLPVTFLFSKLAFQKR